MDFATYERQLNEPYQYNPIDISVGFYGLCSYQHIAWDYVFQRIREHYPTAPIVLINDGLDQYDYSEMARKYNCIHLIKDREICLHYPDISSSHEFLHRTKQACDLLNTDWIIHLHPDVICQGKISYLPPSELAGVAAGSSSGVSGNNWIDQGWNSVVNYIRSKQPSVELNGWGWCGGSIMNRTAFYKVYDSVYGNNPTVDLQEVRDNTNVAITEHEDTMMSVLFALNGFSYRIWKDNPEYHRGRREGAFLHGFKEHYDFKKQGLSDAEYFARCRYQNITKRKDTGLLEEQNYTSNNQKNI